MDTDTFDVDPDTGEALDWEDDESLDTDDEAEAEEPPSLFYPRVDAFVEDFLSVIYERPLPNGRRTWCPQWWKHDEAVYRLQALWLSWEATRLNDGALASATWLVNYADPIMHVLLDVEGPFYRCSVEHGHRDDRPHEDARLPCEAPPEGQFEERQ